MFLFFFPGNHDITSMFFNLNYILYIKLILGDRVRSSDILTKLSLGGLGI